jgi:hypothetical protein
MFKSKIANRGGKRSAKWNGQNVTFRDKREEKAKHSPAMSCCSTHFVMKWGLIELSPRLGDKGATKSFTCFTFGQRETQRYPMSLLTLFLFHSKMKQSPNCSVSERDDSNSHWFQYQLIDKNCFLWTIFASRSWRLKQSMG